MAAYPKFKLKNTTTSKEIRRSTPLPESIRVRLTKELGLTHISTYEDAAFTKQLILDGETDAATIDAVVLLEKAGIIPSGNTNLKFG
jgi:hypothetical protein